jgi:hypothetical protein
MYEVTKGMLAPLNLVQSGKGNTWWEEGGCSGRYGVVLRVKQFKFGHMGHIGMAICRQGRSYICGTEWEL